MKEPAIDGQQPIIANGQSSEVPQPATRALSDPAAAIPAQPAPILVGGPLVVGPSQNNRLNPVSDEQSPGGSAVIGAVGNQSVRPLAGASRPVRVRDGNRVKRGFEEADLRRGCRVQVCSQRSTRTIDHYHPRCAFATLGPADFGAPLFRQREAPIDEAFVPAQFLGIIQLGQQRPPQSQQHAAGFSLSQLSPAHARTAIPLGQFAPWGTGPAYSQNPFKAAPCVDGGAASLRRAPGRRQMGTNVVPLHVRQLAPCHAVSFRQEGSWRPILP